MTDPRCALLCRRVVFACPKLSKVYVNAVADTSRRIVEELKKVEKFISRSISIYMRGRCRVLTGVTSARLPAQLCHSPTPATDTVHRLLYHFSAILMHRFSCYDIVSLAADTASPYYANASAMQR